MMGAYWTARLSQGGMSDLPPVVTIGLIIFIIAMFGILFAKKK